MDEQVIIDNDLDALVARIMPLADGLVTFDGVDGAGKTGTMLRVGERLGCLTVDIDRFLDRHRGQYVEAIRYDELQDAIEEAERISPLLLMAGVCMRDILQRLARTAQLSIYVQAMSTYGLADQDILDAEDGKLSGVYADLARLGIVAPLDNEVWNYHCRTQPRRRADIIFLRRQVL